MIAQRRAHLLSARPITGHHAQEGGGEARLPREVREGEGAERGGLGGLEHHRAARCEGGGALARDHGEREVPRRNRRHYAHRGAGGDEASPVTKGGDQLPISALRLLGVPLHKGGPVAHLTSRLGERFTRLKRDQLGERTVV